MASGRTYSQGVKSRQKLEVPTDVVGIVARVHHRDLGERAAAGRPRVHRERQALVARLVDERGHVVEASGEARLVRLDAEVESRAAGATGRAAEEDGRGLDGVHGVAMHAARADGNVSVHADAAEGESDDGKRAVSTHGVDDGVDRGTGSDGRRLDSTEECECEGDEGEEHCVQGCAVDNVCLGCLTWAVAVLQRGLYTRAVPDEYDALHTSKTHMLKGISPP